MMRAWWEALKIREKLLLSVVAIVVLVILVDVLVVTPFQLQSQQLEQQIEQAQDDYAWISQGVLRLPSGEGGSAKTVPSGRVVSYIDQQINRMGLKEAMQQMTPIQDHSVRLRLEDVKFDSLLNFLANIDGAIFVDEARILPADKPGFVNVSLILTNGNKA